MPVLLTMKQEAGAGAAAAGGGRGGDVGRGGQRRVGSEGRGSGEFGEEGELKAALGMVARV